MSNLFPSLSASGLGARWTVCFIDPEADPLEAVGAERGSPDEATWLVHQAMCSRPRYRGGPSGTRSWRFLDKVNRDIRVYLADKHGHDYPVDVADIMADVYIRSAIMRPDSVFGVGIRMPDYMQHVVFRRDCFTRHRNGALEPVDPCVNRCAVWLQWPDDDAWYQGVYLTNEWARLQGLME